MRKVNSKLILAMLVSVISLTFMSCSKDSKGNEPDPVVPQSTKLTVSRALTGPILDLIDVEVVYSVNGGASVTEPMVNGTWSKTFDNITTYPYEVAVSYNITRNAKAVDADTKYSFAQSIYDESETLMSNNTTSKLKYNNENNPFIDYNSISKGKEETFIDYLKTKDKLFSKTVLTKDGNTIKLSISNK